MCRVERTWAHVQRANVLLASQDRIHHGAWPGFVRRGEVWFAAAGRQARRRWVHLCHNAMPDRCSHMQPTQHIMILTVVGGGFGVVLAHHHLLAGLWVAHNHKVHRQQLEHEELRSRGHGKTSHDSLYQQHKLGSCRERRKRARRGLGERFQRQASGNAEPALGIMAPTLQLSQPSTALAATRRYPRTFPRYLCCLMRSTITASMCSCAQGGVIRDWSRLGS